MRIPFTYSLLACAVLSSSVAFADQSPAQLGSTVISASGFEQKITDAPASISVVSNADLQKKRYSNLAQALGDVEGIDIKRYFSLFISNWYWFAIALFISLSIAYGINNNLLDKATYCPISAKAWTALMSIVDEDGKLGWVQPIGADPKKVTSDMTASYGVGALLLAGSEIYKM